MKVNIPEDYKPYLRIGTCSWKFDSWKGLFYDADNNYRPDDYLADYSRHLDSVEIDQWFWSLFPGGIKLPDIGDVYEKFHPATADFCIIRLHGGDRLEIETKTGGLWNRVISPKTKGLKAAAQIVRTNRKLNILTFVNLNNHFEGSAPVTAERFIKTLEKNNF